MQQQFLPDTVFAKYIAQAEKANDWMAVQGTCDVRYSSDKRNCQNEQIIRAWNSAESALKLP
jgi:quinolinate synthase